MTAVLIPTASEAEWLDARRQGVTASEIAVVMGLSPYSSPYALYHQKLGILPPEEQNDAMQLGDYMEQFVADRFAERHREFQVYGNGRLLYRHADRPWQLATPDRLLAENIGYDIDPAVDDYGQLLAVLETKIDGGSDEWGEEGTGEIPVHYRCQVLWQCRVMGVTSWYVAAFLWHRRQVRVYEGVIDEAAEADLALMEAEAGAFLKRLETGDAPDVDYRPATTQALKTLYAPDAAAEDAQIARQMAISYRAAVRRYRQAEQRKDEMTNRLRQAMGTSLRAVDIRTGEAIATRQVYDVKEHVRKASHVDKLVPAKPKKEKSNDRPDSQ